MNKQKLFWKIPSALILFLIIIIAGCGQRKTEGNIKWIAKFDFFDLYKTKVNGGFFNPGSAITIKNIVMLDVNTIILIAVKEESQFPNPQTQNNRIVIFASKDRGKSYKEIPTGEEDFDYTELTTDFTLIVLSTMDERGIKNRKIFTLNNQTLELSAKLYSSTDTESYSDFDGKYIVKQSRDFAELINVFNPEERFEIPASFFENNLVFYNLGNGLFNYMEGQEIKQYNIKTKETKVIKHLPQKFDYYWYAPEQSTFGIKKPDKEEKLIVDVYDENNHKLFEYNKENRNFYRYKNFVCDTTDRSAIRFSYDYGKTWKVHNIKGFSILQNIFGFYKDEFLVTEGIFFHGDSPESGGRIMVGEFEK